ITPPAAKTMPTPWEKRGGASGSVRVGGPSRGRTRCRYTRPYGAYRSPASAPMANTASCTPSSQALLVSRTTARTTVVITAPNRGPRGSMSMVVLLAAGTGRLRSDPDGRAPLEPMGAPRGSGWTGTDRGGDVAEVDGTPLR